MKNFLKVFVLCLVFLFIGCDKDNGFVDPVINHVDGTWIVMMNDSSNEGIVTFNSFGDMGQTVEMDVKRGSKDEFGSYPFGSFSSTINPNQLYLSIFRTADDFTMGVETPASVFLYPMSEYAYDSYKVLGLPLYEKDNIKLIKQQ